jgi:hypothetical protein
MLRNLQRAIEARWEGDNPFYFDRLWYAEVQGKLHVEFMGSPFNESYSELLNCLIRPDVSSALTTLSLRGPDEGANGTRTWDIGVLTESKSTFPQLESLHIEQTKATDHNRSIVAAAKEYEEAGALARMISKAPALTELTVPSAPDASFFDRPSHPLRFLSVHAGYDHQSFVLNLANSACFSGLSTLEFCDLCETHLDDWKNKRTTFDDWQALFRSNALKSLSRIVMMNVACSPEQLRELRGLRPKMQILVANSWAEYLR